jgi:hypothetical protein
MGRTSNEYRSGHDQSVLFDLCCQRAGCRLAAHVPSCLLICAQYSMCPSLSRHHLYLNDPHPTQKRHANTRESSKTRPGHYTPMVKSCSIPGVTLAMN